MEITRRVELTYPGVIVPGLRRTSKGRIDSWAPRVVNPDDGRMVAVDEKGAW